MCCCVRCGAVQYMRADFVSWASLSGQNTQKGRRHPRNVLQRPLSSSEASSPVGRAVPSLSRLCCNSPVDSVLPRCRAGGVPLGPSRLSRRGLRLPQIALAAALSSLEGPPSPSPKPNDRPDPSALTTHSPLSRLTSPPLLAHIPPFLHSSSIVTPRSISISPSCAAHSISRPLTTNIHPPFPLRAAHPLSNAQLSYGRTRRKGRP